MLCGETVPVCCENRTEHTDTLRAVRTSQETHYISVTRNTILLRYRAQPVNAIYGFVHTTQETHYV
jgi:hypothetical protein